MQITIIAYSHTLCSFEEIPLAKGSRCYTIHGFSLHANTGAATLQRDRFAKLKLSALIPPPRTHLVRWAGVFAPNSPYRKEITLRPEVKKGFQFEEEAEGGKTYKNRTWSKMLARVFKIDVMACPDCGGTMRALCSVTDSFSVRRYLKHLKIGYQNCVCKYW